MTLWRIAARKGRHAVSGDGARLYGGRWNRPGLRAVYASEQLSLAVLETLVHLDTDTPLASAWVIRIDLPISPQVTRLSPADLESGWDRLNSPVCEKAGTAWLESGAGPILVVPSAIVPEERNVILNPEHTFFADGIPYSVTRRFSFDARLRG